MDENVIATSDDERFRVRLEIEQDPESPRTNYDNLTHVVTVPDQRDIDVDSDGGPLADGWSRLRVYHPDDMIEIFTRWARIFHGAVTVEHNPYKGARSLWYLMPDDLSEIGIDPETYIKGDIAEYQAWDEGEVYRYVIEKAVDWGRRDGKEGELTTWEEVDSLGSYYGWEFAEQAAKLALDIHLKGQN